MCGIPRWVMEPIPFMHMHRPTDLRFPSERDFGNTVFQLGHLAQVVMDFLTELYSLILAHMPD